MPVSEGFFRFLSLGLPETENEMSMIDKEQAAMCALNRLLGYNPVTAHRLVSVLGSAAAVFELDPRSVPDALGAYSKQVDGLSREALDKAWEELEGLDRQGYRFICCTDPDYPALLKECEDAPVGLYVRSGSTPDEVFGERPAVAIVGTRDLSLYGKEWCRRIVEAMARSARPPLIVSGFALGTDIVAQATALECGLPTVAVLPTGIDDIYPQRHRTWAERMDATPGCALVTDYPPGTAPVAVNFLRRNRIIAGLSSATVLIESRKKGGGLITADFAFGYARDVYALPGRVDDPRSQGCNLLIKRRIAEAIVSPETLVSDLGLGAASRRNASRLQDEIERLYGGTAASEELAFLSAVAECIRKNRGITPEEIALRLGSQPSETSAATAMLEAEGIIETDLMQGCCIRTKVG